MAKPRPTIAMSEEEREARYGKKVVDDILFVVRVKIEGAKCKVLVHQKDHGNECLPLAYFLGSNALEY